MRSVGFLLPVTFQAFTCLCGLPYLGISKKDTHILNLTKNKISAIIRLETILAEEVLYGIY